MAQNIDIAMRELVHVFFKRKYQTYWQHFVMRTKELSDSFCQFPVRDYEDIHAMVLDCELLPLTKLWAK